MNIVTLTGNATKDIELKYLPTGTPIANGTIAVRRDFKNKEGEYESDFINFSIIGKLAEIMSNYIHKGDKFGINGRLQIRTWDDDQGKRQYFTEVVVDKFDFPDKKRETNSNGSSGSYGGGQQQGNTNTGGYGQQQSQGQQGGYVQQQQNTYAPPQQQSNQNQQTYTPPQSNYQRVDNDPFTPGGGPIEVSDDDLPF